MKLLVVDRLAGVIIGKGGSGIAEFEQEFGTTMRLSGGRIYFPGTNERVMVVGGELDSIERLIPALVAKVNEGNTASDYEGAANFFFRLVLTNSACSCIIGKGGEVIKSISAQTGASIRASDRMGESGSERIVEIKSLHFQPVVEATIDIVRRIQEDSSFREYAQILNYHQSVPPPPANNVIMNSPDSSYFYPNLAAAAGAAGAQSAASTNLKNANGVLIDQYPLTIDFNVPSHAVGAIIGKNGEARNRIVHSTGANLVVSERTTDPLADRKISISGPFAAVQAALALVIKVVVESG
jgi:transcription antitermination factor NusA-like protein